MNVGKFRHVITIQRPDYDAETKDEFGRREIPWITKARVYAHVADVSGREFYEAAAHQLQNTVTFTMRWIHGVNANMRIIFDGDIYEIDQVNHLGYKRDFLRIKAHAVASEGAQTNGKF